MARLPLVAVTHSSINPLYVPPKTGSPYSAFRIANKHFYNTEKTFTMPALPRRPIGL